MSDTKSTTAAASDAGSALQASAQSAGGTNASEEYTVSGINEGPYFKYREELGASGRQDTRVSSYGQPGNTMATQMLPGSRNLQDVEGDLTWVRDQLASQKSTEGK